MPLTQFNKTLTGVFRRTGIISHVFELKSNSLLPSDGEHLVILDWPSYATAGSNRFKTFIEFVQLKTILDGPDRDQPQTNRPMPPGSKGRPVPNSQETEFVFSDDASLLQQKLKKLPVRTMAHMEEDWQAYVRDQNFLYGAIKRDQLLQLSLRINTDSKGFLQWTNPNPQRRISFNGFSNDPFFEIAIQVRMYSSSQEERGEIRIRLDSCEELGKYPGFVALDFGNNSSTIACLPAESFSADEVQLVNADPRISSPGSQPSLDSKLRIIRYEPPNQGQDPDGSRGLFGTSECSTGVDATVNRAVEGCLVEGLKPLLADPNEDPPLELDLETGQRSIKKSDAGELFLAELFKAFHRERLARAIPITLTYPTTYALGEIDRLKVAVTRAYYRAMLMPGLDTAQLWDEMPKIIGEQIDEATAAAFYYLYRDFIEGPGKTAGLKYIYPLGLNLLLYDCGGGTTDIALVHAYPRQILVKDTEGRSRETWQVKISLLGRTGHRSFGGDNITAAMALAVKWLIASEIDDTIEPPSVGVSTKKRVEIQLLTQKCLPTAWRDIRSGRPMDLEPNQIRVRKAATNDLVRYAEEVKIQLSEMQGNSVYDINRMPDLTGFDSLSKLIESACADVSRRRSSGGNRDAKEIKKTQILTSIRSKLVSLLPIVDDIIRDDVDLTVRAANNLIRERLIDPTSASNTPVLPELVEGTQSENAPPILAADSCVHWVYVVGKASQYPGILQRLREGLDVADLQPIEGDSPAVAGAEAGAAVAECRLVLEKEMLKGAVARGAVLTRMFCKNVQDVEIVYDRKMPLKLAFELGIRLAGRGIQQMFKSDSFYHHLTPFEFDSADQEKDSEADPGQNDDGKSLIIYRRWPGMDGSGKRDGWEDYLLFDFPESPCGRISIGYEPYYEGSREYAFVATVLETGQKSWGVEFVKEMFQSPLQRGQL